MEQYAVRPDLARAIVQSGWDLTELRTVASRSKKSSSNSPNRESKPAATRAITAKNEESK